MNLNNYDWINTYYRSCSSFNSAVLYESIMDDIENKSDEIYHELEKREQDQIDEFIDLYIQIKKAYIRYKILKHNILKQAEKEGPGIYKSSSESGNIHVQEFKSQFRSVLTKEFSKLDIKKKRELFKRGLLKIQFRLDSGKYQELKDKKLSSDIDKFAIKRKNNLRFFVKLSNKAKKQFSELEQKEKELDKYDRFAFEDKIEQMIDAIDDPEFGDYEERLKDWEDFFDLYEESHQPGDY